MEKAKKKKKILFQIYKWSYGTEFSIEICENFNSVTDSKFWQERVRETNSEVNILAFINDHDFTIKYFILFYSEVEQLLASNLYVVN